jgi:hypothetical protein
MTGQLQLADYNFDTYGFVEDRMKNDE